jgi:hypothetical protein
LLIKELINPTAKFIAASTRFARNSFERKSVVSKLEYGFARLSLIASADKNTAIKERKTDEITEYSKPSTPIKGKRLSITEKINTNIAHIKYFLVRNINNLLD